MINRGGKAQEAFNKIASTGAFQIEQYDQKVKAFWRTLGKQLMHTVLELMGIAEKIFPDRHF